MDLKELYNEMNQLVEKMQAFLDENEDEAGELTAEDTAKYEAMDKRLRMLQNRIKRREEVMKADKFLRQPAIDDTPTVPESPSLGNPFSAVSKKARGGISGRAYREQFLNAVRTNFKKAKDYLSEASLPDGGYLLPSSMHDEIISALTQENIFRQIGKTITTASEHKLTIVTTQPTATWVSEGQEVSFSKEEFQQVSLSAYKMAVAVKISNELLQDSYYDVEAHLTNEFGKAFARAEENAFLNGKASGEPKGILPKLSESARGTLQTAGGEITADDLVTLQYSVDRAYRGKACWLMSDATLAQIRRLKDANQNFVWQTSLQESEPPRLFGQPVYSSAFMPAPSAGNVAVLYGNFADYFLVGERGQREFRPLRELYALSGQTAFLMTERIDAVVTDTNAIRGLKIRG